jgi:hypothetical protein
MSFGLKTALAVVVVVAIAAVLIFSLRSGEEGAVRAVVEAGVACARQGDAEGCIGLIDKEYSHAGVTYAAVCSQVRTYVRPGKWEKIDVSSIDASVEGSEARATVRLQLLATGMPRALPMKMELQFKRTPAGWRVSGYDVDERLGQ